ncbi:hypothetical protein EXS73_00575 [Candidatus Pacearchaeota archaeon]|nr:hypothetical protein [Candidatus Pacearchaeota archaeon]
MRSLTSASDTTSKRSSQLFLYFAVGIMIVSSVGYAFLSSPSSDTLPPDTSNAPTGIQDLGNGVWSANVYGASFQFLTSPDDVGNVTLMTNITLAELVALPIEYNIASPSLGEAVGMTVGQLVASQPVCIGNCVEDVPERDCTTPVISWNQTALVERVYQQKQCIIIEGSRTAFDAWVYRLTSLA